MKARVHVGQKVYVVPHDSREAARECEVTKVGNKYFYTGDRKFDIETMLHVFPNYSPRYTAYHSIQHYQNEREAASIRKELRSMDYDILNLDKLRYIKKFVSDIIQDERDVLT